MTPETLAKWQRAPSTLALALGLLVSACGGDEPAEATAEPVAEAATATTSPSPEAPQGGAQDAAGDSGKPLLSEKVREITRENDVAAANVELMNFYSSGLDDYELDEDGILTVAREYLEAGDDTTAEVVVSFLQMAAYQVTGTVSAGVWAAHGDIGRARGDNKNARAMYELALREDPDFDYAKQRMASLSGGSPAATPTAASSAPAQSYAEIERRYDLARFRFKYVDPKRSDREIWISETCNRSGILRAVPQWMDSEEWIFQSLADNIFEQFNTPAGKKPVRFEFEISRSDAALSLDVSGPVSGHFEQGGYLPEGWEPEFGTCD